MTALLTWPSASVSEKRCWMGMGRETAYAGDSAGAAPGLAGAFLSPSTDIIDPLGRPRAPAAALALAAASGASRRGAARGLGPRRAGLGTAGPARRAAAHASGRWLADGAVHRPAPAYDAPLHGGAAARAGLAVLAVDRETLVEPPGLAAQAAVIAEGRAVGGEALRQHFAQGRQQRLRLVAAQGRGRGERVHAGAPQALVGVDVPHAGYRALA